MLPEVSKFFRLKDVLDAANKQSGFSNLNLMELWKIADAVIIEV